MNLDTKHLVLGLDFGSDSVRALLIDAKNGAELATSVAYYPRWKEGKYCKPQDKQFRQHPLDYIETMESVIRAVLAAVPGSATKLAAIGVDTTGSTPVLTDASGTPLSLLPEFAEEADAMFVLWKDHTGIREAEDINTLARTWGGEDFTKFAGGIYSSEWFWAKTLRILRTNKKVASAAKSVLEHCDWIPALLTGQKNLNKIPRSRCAAGHKALWHPSFGAYPNKDFLAKLHEGLPVLAESFGTETLSSDKPAGSLCAEWAQRLGLNEGVIVAVGAFDAHMGAVGGGVKEGTFLRIMGTSTCDIMVGPRPAKSSDEKLIRGICGQVDSSVLPGLIGYEAGQSAYGDVFAWFRRVLAWPSFELAKNGKLDLALAEQIDAAIIPLLDTAAKAIPVGSNEVLAIDWFNGRRTPDANQNLSGALSGMHLGTDAPALYRALVEAVAYGSKAIVDRFREEGVRVDEVAAIGGVAQKSAFVMQTLADVLGMKIQVAQSEQACALGAGIFAAVAAGLYPDALKAQAAMASKPGASYIPDTKNHHIYQESYKRYKALAQFIETQALTHS